MWPVLRRILPLVLVVLYFLSPIDLLPDFLVGLGWIDDLILIGLLIWFLSGRSLPFFSRFGSSYGSGQWESGRTSYDSRRSSSSSARRDSRDHTSHRDPHTILGVRPGASDGEIREAYRAAASKYHPDKVSHLGQEFQELAHRRFVAIQQAYNSLMKNRRR